MNNKVFNSSLITLHLNELVNGCMYAMWNVQILSQYQQLFRLKGEHSIIIMSSGNSIYCLDYKGDIDRCIRYGRKHFIFCIRMDHQRPHINKARCDMLAANLPA
jgi:ADP-glucose pyrophosphorylase